MTLLKSKSFKIFLVILSLLIFLFLWDDILRGNEAQTLANVFHFANADWLTNDWFLSLDTSYRIPFNIILYPLAVFLPISILAVLARIMLITVMAAGITRLLGKFNLSMGTIALFILITFRMKGMLAGEDMLWHVESKVLAYGLIIFALSFLLEKRYTPMWLFLGGAVALHPLVGGYSIISLVYIFFTEKNDEKLNYIKKLPFFFITSWPGLWVIFGNLLTQPSEKTDFINELYFTRHPHHMDPTHFIRHIHKGFPAWFDYSIIIGNLIFIAIIIAAAWIFIRQDSRFRIILKYSAGAATIFAMGLILYASGKIGFLKYYPFRFADVILPFSAYLIFFFQLDSRLIKKREWLSRIILIVVLFGSGALFLYQTYQIASSDRPITMLNENNQDAEMLQWIQSNTEESTVFIINPGIDNFNISANRAQFVSLKHIPQDESEILLWYEKLKSLNRGVDFFNREKMVLESHLIDENYNKLTDSELLEIRERWGVDYFIGEPDRDGFFKSIYQNDRSAVYLIR
ncbi:MAG: hypothetical protein JEY99_09265 [Spirochaetales bacterium]|nr:hypothetical protein [Spirochaetales bacterium]